MAAEGKLKGDTVVVDGVLWRWVEGAARNGKVHLFRCEFSTPDGSWKPGSFCGSAHGGDYSPQAPTSAIEVGANKVCSKCVEELRKRGLETGLELF